MKYELTKVEDVSKLKNGVFYVVQNNEYLDPIFGGLWDGVNLDNGMGENLNLSLFMKMTSSDLSVFEILPDLTEVVGAASMIKYSRSGYELVVRAYVSFNIPLSRDMALEHFKLDSLDRHIVSDDVFFFVSPKNDLAPLLKYVLVEASNEFLRGNIRELHLKRFMDAALQKSSDSALTSKSHGLNHLVASGISVCDEALNRMKLSVKF
jgi:hypothetical protein